MFWLKVDYMQSNIVTHFLLILNNITPNPYYHNNTAFTSILYLPTYVQTDREINKATAHARSRRGRSNLGGSRSAVK